ncbi:MAG: epoxyqueuosine reductase QueH [Candidatus Omnitrophica bacterium]|nr:epoxyqueuosine reductase QueH [Candidatus Omnitrophota bacterium]MDD5518373.1 epoxyqueuosine reductase QueH [Candidatus Omnitrophota bacterium]
MELLLHTCCAPCLIYPLEVLRNVGFKVTGFFYNPNIHPLAEYLRRKEALAVLSSGIEFIYPEYSPQEFFRLVNLNEEAPERCSICWRERLKKTARSARSAGFKYFTTTLLVSPYQDQELLKKIGNEVAAEEGVEFYYADFRAGFRKAHDEAKAKGVYCQRYCGCIYSEIERSKKK